MKYTYVEDRDKFIAAAQAYYQNRFLFLYYEIAHKNYHILCFTKMRLYIRAIFTNTATKLHYRSNQIVSNIVN